MSTPHTLELPLPPLRVPAAACFATPRSAPASERAAPKRTSGHSAKRLPKRASGPDCAPRVEGVPTPRPLELPLLPLRALAAGGLAPPRNASQASERLPRERAATPRSGTPSERAAPEASERPLREAAPLPSERLPKRASGHSAKRPPHAKQRTPTLNFQRRGQPATKEQRLPPEPRRERSRATAEPGGKT